MKKMFFFAVAAMMLASCANEETVLEAGAQREIGFKAITTNASRDAVTAVAGWAAPIYVFSAYKAVDTYANFFTTPYVTFTYGSGLWTYTPTYYYPTTGLIDFCAFSTGTPGDADDVTPESASVARNASTGVLESMTLDYTTASHKLAGKTDVMYAMAGNLTCPQSDFVPLTMNHSLSWLTVTMSDSQNQVKVKSLNLNNAYLTGSVTIPITSHDFGTPVWTTNVGDKQDNIPFEAYCPAAPTLINEITNPGPGILVVPGAQTQMTLVYEMLSTPGVEIPYTIDLSGYDAWKPGYHYTYQLSFSPVGIEFKCSIAPYTADDKPISI